MADGGAVRASGNYKRSPLPQSVLVITLTPKQEKLIRDSDASQLRELIISGELTCKQAVVYFALRCFKHGRYLNIVAQEHYDRAMQLADRRDCQLQAAHLNGTTNLLGAFFGVPISIKDHISEEGE